MKNDPSVSGSRSGKLKEMRETAAELIAAGGIVGLRMNDVTDKLKLKSRTLPLHYFGSMAGLIGAVAEDSFRDLATQLANARKNAPRSIKRLERVALAHGSYGLERPLLYQAVHSANLWKRAARSDEEGPAADKTEHWKDRAKKARDAAFAEYVNAVRDVQEAGALRAAPPARIANLLSALVDGFLFQVREEQVSASASTQQHLAYLASLVRLAIGGLRSPRDGR